MSNYPKRFMCLRELEDLGLPRRALDKWKDMDGFPRVRTPGGRKILVDTSQLDFFLEEFTEKQERKEKMLKGITFKYSS